MRLPAYRELSKEQDTINNLPLDKSYLVTGPPGTGKTVMALYRAGMVVRRNVKVSLLMHSRLLSQYTASAVKELEIEGLVNTFHSWFGGFYRTHYRRAVPHFDAFDYDWNEVLTQIGSTPPPPSALEHLIVDEGQDLHRNFYPIAKHVAKCVTVFADENQRLTETSSTIADITRYGRFDSIHELTRNYRNTAEIARLAAHFCTGLETGIAQPPTRTGERPVVQGVASLHETVEFIARYERNNPDKQIGVFVPYARQRDSLFNRLSAAGRTRNPVQRFVGGKGREAEVVDFNIPGIVILCYSSAKGLEFDTVFLPELQVVRDPINASEFKMKFYVLISRAREMLYLMYSGEGEPRVLEAFPPELVEYR